MLVWWNSYIFAFITIGNFDSNIHEKKCNNKLKNGQTNRKATKLTNKHFVSILLNVKLYD